MNALVIRSTGSSFVVLTDDGQTLECHVKGNMRLRGIRTTNPVAVGDCVNVLLQSDGTAWITGIEPRRNYIIRRATNLSKEAHILAANIDQTALIVTIAHPATATTFIDRFLATAEAYRVPAVLVFNKTDLLDADGQEKLESLRRLYAGIGYSSVALSALQPDAAQQLAPLFAGKTTLLSGNSGVGKSTLLNAVLGEQRARTGSISAAHDKGMHTTTFSEMFELDEATSLIDTPGIKGFGTIDFKKEEVGHYFPEIFKESSNCRFGNCTHIHEPGCSVLRAIEEHTISISRYNSYLSIMEDCDEGKYR